MDNNFEYRVYLKSLSKQFPTIADAATEIINLQAILSLPKGTEHFLTDIHGEYEQFNHVLKNGSGSVRRKIDEEFGNTLSVKDKRSLATLIYYPQEKLELVCQEEEDQDVLEDWFKITIHRLVQMTKRVSSKYTRSKVRKALPHDFSYVIEELITEKEEIQDKELYYNEIINTIIRIGRAPECIIALCNLIQRLVIDHLHIVGDIYDRGKGPHVIMDTLSAYHSVDIQWGNHDIVWMGAASGQTACMATVLRISARYGNLDTLEEGYGINLIPLATFALKTYENSDCSVFSIKYGADYDVKDLKLDMMMHKAIAIIQFKLEGQLILAHPEYHMDDRLLLDKIDFEKGTVRIGDKEYEMLDSDFPRSSRSMCASCLPRAACIRSLIPICSIMAVCRWTKTEILNRSMCTASSAAAKSFTRCWKPMPARDITLRIRKNAEKGAIPSGISGRVRSLRYSARIKWRPLSDISSQIRKHIRKRKTLIIACMITKRF